jgi:hypothetical protein
MKKGKAVRRVVGNNPAPVAGVLDVPVREQPKVPPHQPPITAPDPEPVPPDAKRSFIDQLADGFRQIPPGRYAYYRVDL